VYVVVSVGETTLLPLIFTDPIPRLITAEVASPVVVQRRVVDCPLIIVALSEDMPVDVG
jgi:hypothetical protein